MDKQIFIGKLNKFRNKVANKGFGLFKTNAANMKYITWNEELEYMAENAIKYLDFSAPKFCASTLRHKHVSIFAQFWNSEGKLWPQGELETIFNVFQSNITLNLPVNRIKRLTPIIDALTDSVGCSYAKYKMPDDENVGIKIAKNLDWNIITVCLFNQYGYKDKNNLYIPGSFCSKCDCFEQCSKQYSNLCEYKKENGVKVNCETSSRKLPPQIENKIPDEYCEKEEDVYSIYTHLHIIYSLIFLSLITHFGFYTYYKHME